MITIQELLTNRFDKHGVKSTEKIKLVRHKDTSKDGPDVYKLYRQERADFLEYQSFQSKPVFHDVHYIVSFIGEEGTRARFIGVYKITEIIEINSSNKPSGAKDKDKYYYKMEEVNWFEDMKERIIVDWGKGRKFNQWYKNNKEIVEIAPGLNNVQFTDYLDLVLSFEDLSEIIRHENNYPDWKRLLSAVYGVYVICDRKEGNLYIGSAYGENGGIWGRWKEYVDTNGHGHNKSLESLVRKDKKYALNFTFSLVAVLSKSSTKEAVIAKEQIYKDKFGTKINGLNNN